MTLPTITLNGTSKDVLVQQRLDVLHLLRAAEWILVAGFPHGRDYPSNEELYSAIDVHQFRLMRLRQLMDELKVELQEISNQ